MFKIKIMSGEDEKHLLGEGKRLAERAVQFDKDGQRTAAIFYYTGKVVIVQNLHIN